MDSDQLKVPVQSGNKAEDFPFVARLRSLLAAALDPAGWLAKPGRPAEFLPPKRNETEH